MGGFEVGKIEGYQPRIFTDLHRLRSVCDVFSVYIREDPRLGALFWKVLAEAKRHIMEVVAILAGQE
jgi:hypothetical protein